MLNDNFSRLELPHLILASGSPRRSAILASVGWSFTKEVPDVDESEIAGEPATDYVTRLAKTKAEAVARRHPHGMVLGADTTVVINDSIIGKPGDIGEARNMLSLLAGNWHEVLTGIAVSNNGETREGLQRTRVKFAPMTTAEIDFLAREGDPLDKAGAYAVQAQAALFIEGIEGDYWNVVGLPINLVYRMISEHSD